MKKSSGGVAVITGASSGIGEACALRLAREGFRVALVARRGDRLDRLVRRIVSDGGQALALHADLALESEREHLYRRILRRLPPVDVMVNNAGLGWYGQSTEMSWKTARQLLRVNVEAALHLTLMCLRDMRRRRRGHIIMIGSIAGGLPSQGVAVYGATKAFVDNFTTALHRELKGTGVHVSVVRAGPVRTEFNDAAQRHPNGRTVPTMNIGVSPDRVAKAVLWLVRFPRRVVYVPWWLRIVPWLELIFGWVIDLVGPLLLRRTPHENRQSFWSRKRGDGKPARSKT